MVVSDGVAKNLVTTLDLGPPRVVLGERLKDMHRQRYGGVTFVSASVVATRLPTDEVHGLS